METIPFQPCVIIPAYNAEATIGALVRRLKTSSIDVLVVSDGSTDRTAIEAIAAGALVISHLHHDGKGAALRLGFSRALEHGYDPLVTMDSDGQHDPDDLPRLLAAARQAPDTIVVGQRTMTGGHRPRLRRWANGFMSGIVSVVTRRRIPDAQCGFRVIRRHTLAAVTLSSRRFEIETEVLLAAVRQGWGVTSVPVRTIDTPHVSRIRPVADGLRFFGVILRYLVLPPRRRRSSEPFDSAPPRSGRVEP